MTCPWCGEQFTMSEVISMHEVGACVGRIDDDYSALTNDGAPDPECNHWPALKVRVEMDDGSHRRLCERCLMTIALENAQLDGIGGPYVRDSVSKYPKRRST